MKTSLSFCKTHTRIITFLIVIATALVAVDCKKHGGGGFFLPGPSKEARLKQLSLTTTGAQALNGPFNLNNTGPYEWQVPKGTAEVSILAITKSAKAKATLGGDPIDAVSHSITVDFNPVLDAGTGNKYQDYDILVTAEDTTTTITYQLRVIEEKSHEAGLQNLIASVGSLNPGFIPETTAYTDYHLPFDTTSIDVTATVIDSTATLAIDGTPATSGSARTIDISSLAADNATVQTVTILVTAEDGTTTRSYTIGLTKQCENSGDCPPAPMDEARLSSLGVNDASAPSPAFGSDNSGPYQVTTNTRGVTTVTINAVPIASPATVRIDGVATNPVTDSLTVSFTGETQDYVIEVTAKNGTTTRTYNLTVNRLPNNDSSLSNLTVSAGSLVPGFSSDTTAYTVELPYDAMSVNVAATLNDTNASMTIDGTGRANNEVTAINVSSLPADGTTTLVIPVVVTAQNGTTTTTYNITFTKQEAPCSNELSTLVFSLGALTPGFTTSTYEYDLLVPHGTASVNVTPTAPSCATITVNGTPATSGEATAVNLTFPATITIVVTATGTSTYTITVIEDNSTENRLSSLTSDIGSWSPAPFSADTFEYTLNVGFGTTSVNLTPTTLNEHATLTVEGNPAISGSAYALSLSGNIDVIIEVTAQKAGTPKQHYLIHIVVGPSTENRLSALTTSPVNISGFTVDGTAYSVTVPYGTSNIGVTATTMSTAATMTIDGSSAASGIEKTVSITSSPQSIPVVVTSQSGAARTVTITVTTTPCNPGNSLSSLTTDPTGTWNTPFASGTYAYTVTEAWGTESVDIAATASVGTSSITINGVAGLTRTIALGAQGSTTAVTIAVTSQCGVTQNYTLELVRGSCNANNNLSSLTTSGGSWNTPFVSGTLSYDVTVLSTVGSIDVTASADPTASVAINGTPGATRTISLGAKGTTTTVNVVVTNQCGTAKTYTLSVIRPFNNDANLTGIGLSPDGTWDQVFSSSVLSYHVDVATGTTSVNVVASLSDINASATINGTPGTTRTIALGGNGSTTTITIEVTAENGSTTKTYTVNVFVGTSPNANLATLTTDPNGSWNQAFTSNVLTYTVTEASTVTSVDVAATAEDSNATINLGGTTGTGSASRTIALGAPGSTTPVTIAVTAQAGSPTKTYTLNLYRACSSNNNLSALTTDPNGSWSAPFAAGTLSYTIQEAWNVSSVDVAATRADSTASVSINGVAGSTRTISLGAQGSTTEIDVVVNNECGTAKTYVLNVARATCNANNSLSGLTTSAGTWNTPFASGTYAYTVNEAWNASSVDISATAATGTSGVTINGVAGATRTISLGAQGSTTTVTVAVTSECGVTRTYALDLVRASCNSNNSVCDLTTSAGTWNMPFASGTYSYTVTESWNVSSVDVAATLCVPATSTVTINGVAGATRTISLGAMGTTTTVTIVVTSECGVTKTYAIDIVRPTCSSNNNLSALTTTPTGTWNTPFASGTLTYTVDQAFGVTSVDVAAIVADTNSTISINGVAGATRTISLGAMGSSLPIEVVVTSQCGVAKTYTINVNRGTCSDNNNLTALSTTPTGSWSAPFASGTLSYTINQAWNVTSVDVAATRADSTASVSINGVAGATQTISLGAQGSTTTVNVVVTSQCGNAKTYTLNVVRATCNNDNTLSSLSTNPSGSWDVAFSSGTITYNVLYDSTTTSVDVTAVKSNANASITINGVAGATRTIALGNPGETVVATVIVTSECSSTKTYTLNMLRQLAGNADLSALTTNPAGTWNTSFDKDITIYNIDETPATTSVNVTATLSDPSATMTINGTAQTSGVARTIALGGYGSLTSIEVEVTAQNGVTKKKYILNVTRTCSSNNNLSALTTTPTGTWNTPFTSGTTSYDVSQAWNVASVDVAATLADSTASVAINGVDGATRTVALGAMGSTTTINMLVTSQCGATKTYTLNVARGTCNANNSLSSLATSAGTWNTPFASGTYAYTVTEAWNVSSVDVAATIAAATSTVTINGSSGATRTITLGAQGSDTTVTVAVTSECGVTQNYVLTVHRNSCSTNNQLSALTTSPAGTWNTPFASGTYAYTVNEAWNVSSVDVAATLADTNSTITINGVAGATRTISLGGQGSTTTVTVAVTSQCGVTQNYVLSVVRAMCSTNNSLSALTTSVGTWNTPFASGTYAYTVNEAWNVSSVDVAATLADTNSTISINGVAGVTRTITLGAQGSTTTVTVAITSQCGVTQNYVLSVVRATCSTNNSLSALSTTPTGTWNTPFASGTYAYTVNEAWNVSSVDVAATLADTNSTITINGTAGATRTVTLGAQGSTTTVTVAVTSQCGVTQNYVLSIVRASCNANNTLSALTTSVGTWNTPFASGTYAYNVTEAWNVSSVDISATLAAGTSSVTINGAAGATRTITLGAQGSTTTVTVAVTSECGVTQNYVLSVVRATCSTNNSLSNITTSAGTWNTPFASGTYAYNVTEAWNATSVDIVATKADSKESVTINGTSGTTATITLGAQGSTTTVTIAVTSECGATQNYVLSLVRGTCSSINSLSNLTTSVGTWNTPFASGTYAYTVNEAWNVSSVDVAATLADTNSTITINGVTGATRTITLGAQGSTTTVTVAVTSQCGVTQNYVLSVVRATCSSNNSLSALTTSVGTWNTPFASGTYAYTVNEAWNVSSVDVVATLADTNSTITINGVTGATRTITLGAQGSTTTVTVAVTSQCGVTQNYVMSVVRATCNANNSLSALSTTPTGTWNTPFASGTYAYTVNEAWNVSSVDVAATLADSNSTITINGTAGATRTITLGAQGSTNMVTVAVTSQCGVTQNYVLSVVRATCNANNSLSALTTSAGTWNTPFASGTFSYTVNEAWNATSVDIVATIAAGTSSVTINGTVGATRTITLGAQGSTTTVTVAVTSECGVTQNYTLDLVRGTCSTNNSLSALTTSVGTWNTPFASGTYAYTVNEAWNVSSIDVAATLADTNSTITINGTAGATRTITLGAQGSTTTVTVAVTSQCGVTQNYVLSVVRATCNTNNSLSNLTTSVGTWNTPFASGTYAYTVNEAWNVSSVDISATVSAGTSSVTINGTAGATRTITLGAQGSTTTATIAVTSECGVTQNYVLSVVRASCNANNSLSALTTSAGTWNTPFASGTYAYTVNEAWNVSSVDISATVAAGTSSVTINGTAGATRTITLGAQGSTTTVTVAVTSECGVTQNYVLSVVRATCSSNNSLSALTTSVGTWNTPFASGTYAYTVNEAWNVSSVDVAATLADTNSTITINGTAGATRTITLGAQGSTTTVTVAVTSQCGVTQNYVLSVVRATCSSNNSLSALTTSAGTWNTPFASGTYAYTVNEAWNVSSVDVVATLADTNSTITINGTAGATRTITLGAQGSTTTVTVAVTSQCGVTQNYVLSVVRATCSSNNSLSALTSSVGTWNTPFASGTYAYTVNVGFAVASVDVTATLADSSATMTINGTTQASGVARTITLGAQGSTTTVTVAVTSQCGVTQNYVLSVVRASCNTTNSLSALTTSVGTWNTPFASGTYAYTVTEGWTVTSVDVTATLSAPSTSTMTINGTAQASGVARTITLGAQGSTTTVTVAVTSECGVTQNYVLSLVRGTCNSVNTLSALTVSDSTLWTPTFASGTTSYHVDVPSTTTSVNVAATVTNVLASANVNGTGAATATIALGGFDSTKTFTVVVTPECGASGNSTYTVDVHRQACSTVNTLSALTVSNSTLWTPTFASGTTSYHVDVPTGTTSVDVVATVTNVLSTANVNGTGSATATIALGAADSITTFTVVVTPQCSTPTNTYTVNVHRQSSCSSDSSLSGLAVSAGALSPSFATGTLTYSNSTIPYCTSSMNVTATTTNANATMTINGSAATSGSAFAINTSGASGTVTIIVTNQCGAGSTTYTINWAKASAPNVDLSNISVRMGTASYRVLYQGGFADANHLTNKGFNASVTTYACVVIGYSSVTVSATLANTGNTMTINGTTVASGGTTTVTLTEGAVVNIPIVVTGASPNTCATKTYTIQARMLNVYEAFYGYYSGVMVPNKLFSWRKPQCDGLSGTNVLDDTSQVNTHTGQISGTMAWQLFRDGTYGGKSRMVFSGNYNNYGDTTNEDLGLPTSNTSCATDYFGANFNVDNESWPVYSTKMPTSGGTEIQTWYTTPYVEDGNSSGGTATTLQGFRISDGARWEAHTDSSGNGFQISNASNNSTTIVTFNVLTTYGDVFLTINNHYRVETKDAIVTAQSAANYSFSQVTYNGVTKAYKYMAQTASVRSLGQPYPLADGTRYWNKSSGGTVNIPAWTSTTIGVPTYWNESATVSGTGQYWNTADGLWPFNAGSGD